MALNHLPKILGSEELLISNDKSADTIASSKYTAKSETERLFGVFENFHKDAANLSGADLCDANLCEVNLAGANLEATDTSESVLTGAIMPNGDVHD